RRHCDGSQQHRLSAPGEPRRVGRGHAQCDGQDEGGARPHRVAELNTIRDRGSAEEGEGSRMNISVIGSGYVGLVVGACLAETGNDVICADVDAAKVDGLKKNELPIYEPGLDAYVERNQRDGRLTFTTDVA